MRSLLLFIQEVLIELYSKYCIYYRIKSQICILKNIILYILNIQNCDFCDFL